MYQPSDQDAVGIGDYHDDLLSLCNSHVSMNKYKINMLFHNN